MSCSINVKADLWLVAAAQSFIVKARNSPEGSILNNPIIAAYGSLSHGQNLCHLVNIKA